MALLCPARDAGRLILAALFISSVLSGGNLRIKPPVYFEPDGACHVVRGLKTGARLEEGGALRLSGPRGRSLSLRFAGGDTRARAEALEPLPGRTHYILGRDPRKWRTGVPQYGRVRYRDVYPGIDVVYYGAQGMLEYDAVVAPGADPGRIRLALSGAGVVKIENGDLLIEAKGRKLRQARPRIYQEIAGNRVEVAGRYAIDRKGQVRIEVDPYDPRKPLVIDPMIVYATLLGGDDQDDIRGLAVDAQGHVYVTGSAGSSNFPGSLSPNTRTRDRYSPDAYVARINAAGTAFDFVTFFGSSNGDEIGTGVGLDSSGNVYVTGDTTSADFPVTANAVKSKPDWREAFLVKLDPSGSRLLYSSLLGGNKHDYAQALAVSPSGHAVIAGYTGSDVFPQLSPVAGPGGGAFDAFVIRVDTNTGKLVYSSAFGGQDYDQALGVTLDAGGNAYLTGATGSKSFPVSANAFQAVLKGSTNAFAVKIGPAGGPFAYSTLLGGSGSTAGNAIAADAAGHAYVVGTTSSTDFPTTTPLKSTPGDGAATEAFIAKLTPDGSRLAYSSPIGGAGFDYGFGVALASSGEAWITGVVQDTRPLSDFPNVNPVQPAWGGGFSDWFLCRVNAAGTALTFSTFIGGLADEGGLAGPRRGGVVIDQAGNVYVAGQTQSGDFPTTPGVFQVRYGGYATATENAGDGFLVKIDPSRDPAPIAVTAQNHVITTVAGGGTTTGAISGPATQAAIGNITAMALHPSGAVLFGSDWCEGAIIVGGNVIPGFCESGPIRSVSPDGHLSVIAGATTGTYGSGDGGPAVKAVLDICYALAADTYGNVYIAEANGMGASNRVWKVDTQGIIHRIAGTGAYGFSGDGGPARDAQLAMPQGLAVDLLGNVYISDSSNGRIRKISPGGIITTIAGGGTVEVANANGIPATQAKLSYPGAIVVDEVGNIYFLEKPYGVGKTIRKLTPDGVIATIAGSSSSGYNGDARPALGARLSASANGLALAPNGDIYIADTGNNRIRRIDRAGMIWNVAGRLGRGSSGDNGPGELAQLDGPLAIAFDSRGDLYIAESHRIRKLSTPRPLPEFQAAGVVSAASFKAGAGIARGSIFSVFGTNMGPAAGLAPSGYPLGAWLSDVTIRVAKGDAVKNAIPVYVSAGQINAIMPSDAPLGDVQLQILYAGFPSAQATVKVVPVNFQFFTAGEGTTGVFQNYTSATDCPLNSFSTPAHPGQIIIGWGTGLGPGLESDAAQPRGNDLPVDVQVLVGGKPAQVLYKGRAPTFAGVDNIYFVLPDDAPSGCRIPVQVRAGGVDSDTVTLAISSSGPTCQ
jgi:uncharacterized protein (TIGR03437 family)